MKLLWILSLVNAYPLSCFEPSQSLFGNTSASTINSASDLNILVDYYNDNLKLSYITCCTNASTGVLEGL